MKRNIKIYSLVAVLAVFISCKVSKDITLPDSAVTEHFRTSVSVDSPGVSIAGSPVKEFITNKEIQVLIDSALIRNFDLQLAVKNIESAELLFRQSKWGNVPALNLGVNANSANYSDNSLSGVSAKSFLDKGHVEDFNTNFTLGWEADIWGKIKGRKQDALARYLETVEAKKAVQTRLIADIAKGYYNLLMLDSQLRIAIKNLNLSNSTLRIIKMQFDAGQVTALAVQQADAQRLVSAKLIPELEQNIVIQENALRILTSEVPAAIQRSSILEEIVTLDHLAVGIPSEMVGRRPDVKTFEYALAAANAKVGIAKANMYPSLNITASAGAASFKASNWFNLPASLFGAVAGGVVQPIFQRKQLRTDFKLAIIEREKVVIGFRQAVLNAVGQVSDEMIKMEKLNLQYNFSLERTQVLQAGVTNAEQLFKSGMANYLEVITAQSNLLQSELELASVKTAQLYAAVELYRSLGGGY